MSDARPSILFLCTGNSSRSILAEAIVRQVFGNTLQARSAGSTPRGTPHPLAIQTLERHGLTTDDLSSESWERYRETPFDLVITLCDSANREACPTFRGPAVRVHWSFPDPPAADDPEATFESVYQTLHEVISLLSGAATEDLPERAREAAKQVAERYGRPTASP